MASVATTARLSARIANRYASRTLSRRAFNASARDLAAQNYTMPALSPTMTEGNIANWRVKEGDSFSAGDVLLEIETDKATMDVEAQDDGILMKIISGDGSKGIAVGTRIAVTAEPGDDLSSLEIPAEEAAPKQNSEKVTKSPPKQDTSESSRSDKVGEPAAKKDSPAASSPESHGGKPEKQKFALSAAVEAILHQNGLSAADADQIKGTGPKGRLLKGDVLAHLGKINKDAPAKLQAHVAKLAHLDLSNIQLQKQPAQAPKAAAAAEESKSEPELPTITELSIPISLSAVIATQKRVQDTLGIFLPLSTFISRASELANDNLPARKHAKPTADDLFNAVLGLDKVSRSSRGSFFPHIAGITPTPRTSPTAAKKADIIGLLAPKSTKPKRASTGPVSLPGISPGANVFTVIAKNGEEQRAEEYLERMRIVLEEEPGRLVL